MTPIVRHATLLSPDETADLAARMSTFLEKGDVILLEGPIGSGKSHFSRAVIQSLLTQPEDVPSPTFTIVQTYETPRFPIWHCDLYRLTHPDEALELGLDEAFDDALCLIEWPDRLGEDQPRNALHIVFEQTSDEERALSFHFTDGKWLKLTGLLDG